MASSMRVSRLLDEAAAGVLQRPGRSVLTSLGTVIGIGAFVAMLGLTTTANAQIDESFNAFTATQVSVELNERTTGVDTAFPSDARERLQRIDGVVDTAETWNLDGLPASALPPGLSDADGARVIAASPAYWNVVEPDIDSGRVFDDALAEERVAVVGASLGDSLGVHGPSSVVFLDGIPFTVIGVVSDTRRSAAPATSIVIPARVATTLFGEPGSSARLIVSTRLGAADTVARQISTALDPIHPERFTATAPPGPQVIKDRVSGDLQALFFGLAVVGLVIGAVGIANANLLGMLGRVHEIGLRRSLGARRSHIAAQFLLESVYLGAFGGMLGTLAGVASVLVASAVLGWTPSIWPWLFAAAPVGGAVVGVLAGVYPAVRASRLEPVEALRH